MSTVDEITALENFLENPQPGVTFELSVQFEKDLDLMADMGDK